MPQQNPHATFLTTFINAIREIVEHDKLDEQRGDTDRLIEFLPFILSSILSPNSPDVIKILDARDSVPDLDEYFQR